MCFLAILFASFPRQNMPRRALLGFTLAGMATISSLPSELFAADGPAAPAVENRAELDAYALAARIDAALAAEWKRNGVEPEELTTDSEFVRRASLDLIGRIPSVAEVRAFLEDRQPDKRRRLVAELLQQGACAAHFANGWRDLLLTGTGAADARGASRGLENWLRLRFSANLPYDQMVSELLTATEARTAPATVNEPSVYAFYQAAEFKPEQLASNVARLFLGLQVQCAQCHDHPFAAWKQPQFWSFAAFFSNEDGPANDPTRARDAKIRIPEKDVTVAARFLDGSAPVWKAGATQQSVIASWITRPENPYFARAIVNRIWEHFCGRGFVDPVDDLDPAHPRYCAAVFDELTQQFVAHRFDLKFLVTAVTATRAYQTSSRAGDGKTDERHLQEFARMSLRRMTSDQLFSSFVQATGFREPPGNPRAFSDTSLRLEFQQKFGDTSRPRTEAETTILQALSLMNGKLVAQATDLETSELLSSVIEAPYLNLAGRIETLYLATLSRPPEADEIAEMLAFCNRHSAKPESALADVFWALLNSAEFILNH